MGTAFVALASFGPSSLATPDAARQIRFDHLSLDQGLSQGAVNCIVQDPRGFMWFGTQDGLNRWDGYAFTVFKQNPDEKSSVSANTIWALHADRERALWIGTDGGGLNRLDLDTAAFTVYRNDPANPASLSSNRVRAILEARDGPLWVGTDGGGLNRFDRARGTFTRFLRDPSNANSPAGDRIRALAESADGAIWIGSDGGGVSRLDPKTGVFTHFRNDPARPESLGSDRVRAILAARDGSIWVGTYSSGVDRLDAATGAFTHFRHAPGNPESLSDDKVWALFEDATGAVWIGTDGGLDEWTPGGGFARCVHKPGDAASLAENRVLSIFRDRGGVLWAGTQTSGVDRASPFSGSFALYRSDPQNKASLPGNTVQAFAPLADGSVWVGTYEGLSLLDVRRRLVRTFRHDARVPGSPSDDRVMSLLAGRNGVLWVGTLEGGLDRLDPGRQEFAHHRHDPANPASLGANGVTSLLEDRDGRLWVGTFRGGLNRLDGATGSFVRYRHESANPASLGDDSVLALTEDASGALWIGTERGGLNRYDRASGAFARYQHDPARKDSLAPGIVFCVLEDRGGTLWVGTQGGGLSAWSAEDRRANRVSFRHFRERDGLPNDTVYGLLEDARGALWISTNRGLSRMDPKTGTFRNFDRTHGLQSNEFNFGAFARAADGRMFFGGNEGFNEFHPDGIRLNPHVPPVVLTSFLKFLKRVQLPKDLNATDELRLNWRDYVVSFEFAALDFVAPAKNRYAYRLEGFDREWIDAGENRRATYTNLGPGRYVFRVKASNNDGIWNEQGASLRLLVSPPPWKSPWAYLLYGALAVAGAAAYVRSNARKLEREAERGRQLEEQVRRRTAELGDKNAQLEGAIQKLEEASLTDSLTGLHNRRFLASEIGKEIALVDRYYGDTAPLSEVDGLRPPRPDFALLMVDLDGLKPVNDAHGHAAGDRVLLQLTEILKHACRASDTLLRWGGDEFLVLARYANPAATEALAERIRSQVAAHVFDLGDGHTVSLGCCVGFAFFPFLPAAPRNVSWEQVVAIADRALYVAKESGRNCWVGILSTRKTPAEETAPAVNRRLESLTLDGSLELRTSLTDPARLVLART